MPVAEFYLFFLHIASCDLISINKLPINLILKQWSIWVEVFNFEKKQKKITISLKENMWDIV